MRAEDTAERGEVGPLGMQGAEFTQSWQLISRDRVACRISRRH
jgi:hypothetical protein